MRSSAVPLTHCNHLCLEISLIIFNENKTKTFLLRAIAAPNNARVTNKNDLLGRYWLQPYLDMHPFYDGSIVQALNSAHNLCKPSTNYSIQTVKLNKEGPQVNLTFLPSM